MSGIRIAFSTCRSGAIDLSGGTLSAFDPLGILFGRQNRLHPAGHLFTLLCHRFTRFFSHLPAFGPVLRVWIKCRQKVEIIRRYFRL
jgi:hypothetical protein